MAGTGYTVKNDRVQDASPAHGWHNTLFAGAVKKTGGKPRAWLAALRQICRKDYALKNEYGQDMLGRRRCFAAPGRCRHARAVYELAHNLMWLDVA